MPQPVQNGMTTVQKGESLTDVANRYGKSLDAVLSLNPQFDPSSKTKKVENWGAEKTKAANGESGRNVNAIQTGEQIRVEAPAAPQANAAPVNAANSNAANAAAPIAPPAKPPGPTPEPQQPGVTVIRKGETLADVAKRSGKSLDDVLKLNPQFDPATKTTTVQNWEAEKAKYTNGENGRNINAVQTGELIRVKELEDAYFVSSDGLQGAVFDEKLVASENNRLMALRRYADGGGAGGAVDGTVTASEAQHFMAWTQSYLTSSGRAGPESKALDSYEQQHLIEEGKKQVDAKVGTGYDDQTRAVFAAAPESFKVQDWPQFTVNKAHSAYASQAFTTGFVPVALGLSPDLIKNAMQNLDSSSSFAVKAFTPNANLVKLTGDENTSKAWLKQFKIHLWAAARGEIAVSRVYVGESGNRTRTATISAAIGYQPEAVFDASLKKIDFRTFVTGNNAEQIQYQITTNPERLSDILSGKILPPNPYDPKTMLPGDVVTITNGPMQSVEVEQRVLFNPAGGLTTTKQGAGKVLVDQTGEVKNESDGLGGGLRAGLDIKFDHATFAGDSRLVVRKLKEDHVQVFHGQGLQETNAFGIGFMANPDLPKASRNAQNASQGAFFRILPQMRDIQVHNTFHFVELDLKDKRHGGGNELYQRILSTGEVPTAQSLQPIRGVIQHGTLDYREAQEHFALQTTFYSEKPKLIDRKNLGPGEKPKPQNQPIPSGKIGNTTVYGPNDWYNILGTNATQLLEQNSIDIMSSVSTVRQVDVRHVYPGLKVDHGAVDHDDAINPETKLGSGAEKTTTQHTELGGVRLTEASETHSGTGARYVWPMLISQNKGDKASVENALTQIIADKGAGKAPLFEEIVINGRDATGKEKTFIINAASSAADDADALASFKARKDYSNDALWGLIDGRDTVQIRVATVPDAQRNNEQKIADFTKQYIGDYMKVNERKDEGIFNNAMRAYGDQAIARSQVNAALLGSEYLNMADGGLNQISLETAKDGRAIREILTGFDLGNWMESVQGYRTMKGQRVNGTEKDAYYPVRIVVDVRY